MSDNRSIRGTPAPSEAGSSQHRHRPTSSDVTMTDANDNNSTKSLIAKPDLYEGDRDKLDDFLNQMALYFRFNNIEYGKQALFATTFLRGRAQHYIKPHLNKFLNGENDQDTVQMFSSFEGFKGRFRTIFGNSNEKNSAVRMIQTVTQKTSAADYAAKFQEYAQLTEWDDDALMVMYRRGLKESVKDELMRFPKEPTLLDDLVKISIMIDDKLYERSMERGRGLRGPGAPRTPYFSRNTRRFNQGHYGDPMDLSNTTPVRRKGAGPKKGFKSNKAGKLTCYACGKEGHMARDCRSKGQQGNVQSRQFNAVARKVQLNVIERAQTPMTEEQQQEHSECDSRAWAVCKRDDCQEHRELKELFGIFPDDNNRNEVRGIVLDFIDEVGQEIGELYTKQAVWTEEDRITAHAGYQTLSRNWAVIDIIDDLGMNEPITLAVTAPRWVDRGDYVEYHDSSSGEEYDTDQDESDESNDQQETLTFTIKIAKEAKELILLLARSMDDIMPIEKGERKLHPAKFDRMLQNFRRQVWNMKQVPTRLHFRNYVLDYPPIGSIFNPDGSYSVCTGFKVTKKMRDAVTVLKEAYGLAEDQQRTALRWNDKRSFEDAARHANEHENFQYQAPRFTPTPVSPYQGKGKAPA